MFVRVKPYNKETGCLVVNYTSPKGGRYNVDAGWYEVNDAEELAFLKRARNDPDKRNSAQVFDIVETLDRANELEMDDYEEEMAHARREVYKTPVEARPVKDVVVEQAARVVEIPQGVEARHVGKVATLSSLGKAGAKVTETKPKTRKAKPKPGKPV